MRILIRLLTLTSLCMISVGAVAQSPPWPSKPIKLVSPYAPGGTNDITARLVAKFMQERLGQPVLVENKPGANNRLATELVARAPADGYTLFWVAAPFTVNPSMYDKLPYDTIKDFTPIAHTVSLPILFSVPAASPARSVKEFVELAARDPKQASVCSPATGSGPHLAMELLAWSSGAPLVHIPYKGDAPAVNDLIGGQVAGCMNAVGTPLPHVRAGRLRALAVVSHQRIPQLPDTPTFAEAGFGKVDAYAWFGLLAPAGLPQPIVERLNTEVNAALKDQEIREKFETIAAIPLGGSPQQFADFIKADISKWAKVVADRNLKAK